MSDEIRVSPRHVGFLATKEGCPRCAWWLHQLRHHPPFSHPMPGLMFAADHSEKALYEYFVSVGKIPKVFKPFDDIVETIPCPGYRKFAALHPAGIWLHGEYDVLGVRKNDSLVVLDHKSAYYKGEDDVFALQYHTQLTGYAWISEQIHGKEVSGVALVYWDPNPKNTVIKDPAKYWDGENINLPLKAIIHELTWDFDELGKLVTAYRKIITSKLPPEGRTGCKNCAALEHVCEIHARIVAQVEKTVRDAAVRFDPALIAIRNMLLHDLHKARFSGLEGWMSLDPEEARLAPEGWFSPGPEDTDHCVTDLT